MLKVEAESSISFYLIYSFVYSSHMERVPTASALLEVAILWLNVFSFLMSLLSVTILPLITPLLCKRTSTEPGMKKRASIGTGNVSERGPDELGDQSGLLGKVAVF